MKRVIQAFSILMVVALAVAVLPTADAFALALADLQGPVTSAVAAAPNPAAVGDTVTVTATVDDTSTGGSFIQSAEFSVNGGPFTAMTASDGTFDSVSEGVTGTFVAAAGDNQICVQGTDVAANVGAATCIAFAVGDTQGPITSAVAVAPNPATLSAAATVTATVDDTTTGGSNIQSAEFSVNGGPFTVMTASDGAFDSPTEGVTGTFTVTQQGDNEVCVQGTDAAGNVGAPTCASFTAESIYTFTGFFPPIRMTGMRPKAGRNIPVKWKLTMTSDGSPVSDRSVFVAIKSYAVDCTTLTGDPTTAVVEKGPGKAMLRYRQNGKWLAHWKTPKAYKNSCRMMFVLFSDGSMSPTVLFRFR